MQTVCTPLIHSFIPGLRSIDDVMLSINTRIAFIDSIFKEPDTVPVNLKWTWLGTTVLQSPVVAKALLSRVQDPEKLFEAGQKGLPLLLLYGTHDTHLKGEVVVECMKEHFKKMEVLMIQGGSHAPFYDDKAEFIEALISFASAKTRMLAHE